MNKIRPKFSRLTVIKSTKMRRGSQCVCLCDCGNQITVPTSRLVGGIVKSCGCGEGRTSHGMSGSKIYKVWASMIRRCKREERYAGRGISVCDRWKSFENFYQDMEDEYKDGLSLDRIDNNGNYYKANCRWTDAQTQARNRRSNRIITVNGEKMSLAEACEAAKLDQGLVWMRLYSYGWSVQDALGKRPNEKRHII